MPSGPQFRGTSFSVHAYGNVRVPGRPLPNLTTKYAWLNLCLAYLGAPQTHAEGLRALVALKPHVQLLPIYYAYHRLQSGLR